MFRIRNPTTVSVTFRNVSPTVTVMNIFKVDTRNGPGKLDEMNYHLSKADGRKLQVLCSMGYFDCADGCPTCARWCCPYWCVLERIARKCDDIVYEEYLGPPSFT